MPGEAGKVHGEFPFLDPATTQEIQGSAAKHVAQLGQRYAAAGASPVSTAAVLPGVSSMPETPCGPSHVARGSSQKSCAGAAAWPRAAGATWFQSAATA